VPKEVELDVDKASDDSALSGFATEEDRAAADDARPKHADRGDVDHAPRGPQTWAYEDDAKKARARTGAFDIPDGPLTAGSDRSTRKLPLPRRVRG